MSSMLWYWSWREHLSLSKQMLRWVLLVIPVGLVTGSACALFLWSLEQVTELRTVHPWLLLLLPLSGGLIGIIYNRFGKRVEGGNNLIVDQIHEPSGGVPFRMAPLVFIATIASHLFGASVGREGTAIQMGGSIAGGFSSVFHLDQSDTKTMLIVGIAAGFGSVFGTPLAGAIFAVEVLAIGKIWHEALFPAIAASILGDYICRAWGIHHTLYHITTSLNPGSDGSMVRWLLMLKVTIAASIFGLASVFFAETTHWLGSVMKRYVRIPALRPVLGGVVIIVLVNILGTTSYIGLGVNSTPTGDISILSAFHANGAETFSWLWKSILTTISLGSGFKGGEVTPLFYIGATLGHTLANFLNAPIDVFAAIGFVAVFAGATNTPLACTVMSVELFGSEYFIYFAVASYLSYFFSGHSGIYLSQRIATPKGTIPGISEGRSLRSLRTKDPGKRL